MNKKFTFILFCFIFFVLKTEAVPAYPYPVTITQPDGTTLTIRLHGDEHRKFRSTMDGYVIKKNNKGFYTYAVRNKKNRIIPGERIARDPEKRSAIEQSYLNHALKTDGLLSEKTSGPLKIKRAPAAVSSSSFPKTGSPRSLVIMVNFKDLSFVVPNTQDAFYRLLNQEDYSDNGGTGSARDYFKAASNGQFDPQFDVVGPYNLPEDMAYYGANDEDTEDDVKPAYMIVDACKAADNAGVDFTQYDTDGDGYIDNVFVYYAGYNEAEWGPENSIWPHRWYVIPGYNYTDNENLIKFDGKKVFDYACTSELKEEAGSNMCGIGTFTHEFGHVIGLPDYYHTEEDKSTLDNWNIMDAGAYLNEGRTPPTYSAYDRFYLGWLTPEEIASPADKSLYPLSQSTVPVASTAKQAYLLSATTHNLNGSNPYPKEFYIMEYRKKTGWDAFLPGEGLLFWHIDYNETAWDENTLNNYTGSAQTASSHMRVYLQPLSGYTDTPGTAFTSGSFDPLTWMGININRPITNITKTADSISFKIMGGSGSNQNLPLITAGQMISESLFFPNTKISTESNKQLNIKTTDVMGDLTLSISGIDAELFTVSTATISNITANAPEGANLYVSYKPLNPGTHTAVLTIFGGGLNPAKVIQLNGTAAE